MSNVIFACPNDFIDIIKMIENTYGLIALICLFQVVFAYYFFWINFLLCATNKAFLIIHDLQIDLFLQIRYFFAKNKKIIISITYIIKLFNKTIIYNIEIFQIYLLITNLLKYN